MMLQLCRNVHNISLHKNCVFYCRCSCAFVAMATCSFHRLIMGKVKVGLCFYLTADILTKKIQKCSWSSPLPNIWILTKPLNLIVCHGNRKAKFANKFSKLISSDAIRGMKPKLCRNVHNISLYKSGISWYEIKLLCFHCYVNLNFPLTYNGKSENWPLLLSHCRYFDKSFSEIFIEWSSTKHVLSVLPLNLIELKG